MSHRAHGDHRPNGAGKYTRSPLSALCSLWLLVPAHASAAWFDNAWPYRRAVDVTWDADRGTGEEQAVAEFYAAGGVRADGADVRVATNDGRVVPSRVIWVGPGDYCRVVFTLVKPARKYYVYWGNATPSDKPPEEPAIKAGLLLESKVYAGQVVDNFSQIQAAWDRAPTLIGRKMIGQPFLGYNPLADQAPTITKLTGSLFAPVDGQYSFAMSVDDKAALFVDGQPVLFANIGPADARHNRAWRLTRGRHAVEVYHVDYAGEYRLTLAWQPPAAGAYQVMGVNEFGACLGAAEGPLEQAKKTLVADFKCEPVGELFFDNAYALRYRFEAVTTLPGGTPTYAWDFGDGQTATGATVDHVYLLPGVHTVRVTAKVGANTDVQTTRVSVTRDLANLQATKGDTVEQQAKLVARYDAATVPATWLPRAVGLMSRANDRDAAMKYAARLVRETSHADANAATEVLKAFTRDLLERDAKQAAALAELWASAPRDSKLQPEAAKQAADLRLWWLADFSKAADLVRPLAEKDANAKRRHAQALLLSGKADEARALLESIKVDADTGLTPGARAAVAGALARTVEARIDDKDWHTGDRDWDRWMARYPSDFLGGYAVLLKVRLMQARGVPTEAARVAEAFVAAVPTSTYAPTLLDEASKLLAKTDAARSAALRERLKQKYPEDPLSQ